MVAALREMDAAAGARIMRGEPRRPVTVPPGEPSAPNKSPKANGGSIHPTAPST
jgi:hypothetical protein